jgi:hypothetical protein
MSEQIQYQTLQELIDTLNQIEDKSQVCIAAVFLADDLQIDNQDHMIRLANSRTAEKEIGFFYEGLLQAAENF